MSDLRKGLQAAIDALRSYEYGNSDPTLAKMTADTLDTLLSTADSEQRETGDRDAVLNEALDRIAYLTDSGSFHGYRSEVWRAVGRVYDAALTRPAEQREVADLRRKLEEMEAKLRRADALTIHHSDGEVVTQGSFNACNAAYEEASRRATSLSRATAALRTAAQELWDAVAHDVTDESKWVGTAMAKAQAALALPTDSLAQEVVSELREARHFVDIDERKAALETIDAALGMSTP